MSDARLPGGSPAILEAHLARWNLAKEGPPIITPTSVLQPVLLGSDRAMLKVAICAEEGRGNRLMARLSGDATAPVLAAGEDAIVMERAEDEPSLARWADSGRDEDALAVLCEVAARLHSTPVPDDLELVGLWDWFAALRETSLVENEPYAFALATGKSLLTAQHSEVLLHGDLHHGNVLMFRDGVWRAIDPKGLRGERTFDFVNLLRNPIPTGRIAPDRFRFRLDLLCRLARLDRERLLRWTIAFCGLSAAWLAGDGESPRADLALIDLARSELGQVDSAQ